MAVVLDRSYSRQMGATSLEIETGIPGSASSSAAATACSWAGFTYEKSRDTATAGVGSFRG